jgi:hypothetical protein
MRQQLQRIHFHVISHELLSCDIVVIHFVAECHLHVFRRLDSVVKLRTDEVSC